jgi:hypothetical protein
LTHKILPISGMRTERERHPSKNKTVVFCVVHTLSECCA